MNFVETASLCECLDLVPVDAKSGAAKFSGDLGIWDEPKSNTWHLFHAADASSFAS
jgi:hypothetical protein